MQTFLNELKGNGINILKLSRHRKTLKPEELDKIISRRIIVYSNPYISDAINLLKTKPDTAALIMEPHDKDRFFRSAFEVLRDQEKITRKRGIPILFTNQSRMVAGGQKLSYLGLLLDILQVPSDYDGFCKECQANKWEPIDGKTIYGRKNFLIIKAPIVNVAPIPISSLLNARIGYKEYAKAANAVSLPSPKIINDDSIMREIETELRKIINN